jgi:hypothetical protein
MSRSVVLNPLGMVDIAGKQVVMSRLVWDDVDVDWFADCMEVWAQAIRRAKMARLLDVDTSEVGDVRSA